MQPPHSRSQVKQRSRLARAVFRGRRDVGGLPGQGPPRREPDRNGSHLGRAESASGGPLPRDPGSWAQPSLPLLTPSPSPPPPPCSHRSPCLPGPWIPACSGSCSRPPVPQPGRWCLSLLGRERPPPFSTESSLLVQMVPREQRHLRVLSPGSWLFCEGLHPTCAQEAQVQSLAHVGEAWRFLSPVASICSAIGPSYVSRGREASRRSSTHTLLGPFLGLGSCTPGTRTSWMSPLVLTTSDVAVRPVLHFGPLIPALKQQLAVL